MNRPKLWRSLAVLAGALGLVGAGVGLGVSLRGGARPAAAGGKGAGPAKMPRPAGGPVQALDRSHGGRNHGGSADAIDMNLASGVECRPPAAPGPAHPDRVLAQLFNVRDSHHSAYLLGWQIVPYRGPGTYRFATAGDLLALEPPAGGQPLGFGKGTVTFFGGSDSGTVHAVVALKSGATLKVDGTWICATAAG